MGYTAKDLIELKLDPATTHAMDTGCMACELDYQRMLDERGRALAVILLTTHIREYLERTDPMALNQVRDALGDFTV